ncbi:MAG: hypothetical protein LBQ84_09845 [Flavobacteriaceae bacterium]|jgi:hypothetical protein|nr:hypothetical protein [Flavobacteriaceae bacterium]
MKITILTPMDVEREKMLDAFREVSSLKHSYEVISSGIGRENTAKGLLKSPESDICVLVGFTAIVGKENSLPKELKKGELVEVVASSLFGYKGEIFENGKLKLSSPKTNLPCLSSLTSDKFVTTTDIPIGTLINMEDYTFMCLKRPQDFIIRIISDFLPHKEEIDFFKVIEDIKFTKVIELLENLKEE